MEPPTWMPDDASDKCMVCAAPFGVLSVWKHHCRLCGQLVCANCFGPSEREQTYVIGSKVYEQKFVPPLSSLQILDHPNASSTRTALSQWLPGSLARHTHIDPEMRKFCGPCGVQLAKENSAWACAYALCQSLTMLGKYRQRVVLMEALLYDAHYTATKDLAFLNGFTILGRWVKLLSQFKFYLADVRKFNMYPFMRQLMSILYSQWYEYIDVRKGMPSSPQTHTILTLLLNLTSVNESGAIAPTMSVTRLKLLLQDTMNAVHLLIGHQILHYSTRVKARVIKECWGRLFTETESLALFMHNRLCCEALCMSRQTNVPSEKPTNGMFRPFFEFLEARLKRVPSGRNPPTYVQAVCALLHTTLYCQPRLAQGCAHVLHIDLDTVHNFYTKCFDCLWSVTHGQPFARVEDRNPLGEYDARLTIPKIATTQPAQTPKVLLVDPKSGSQVVTLGSIVVLPVTRHHYTYAIQHLVRLFFRTQIGSPESATMTELEDRAYGMCSSLHLFFGPESADAGKTIGYLNSSILKLGQLQLVQQAEELKVSILTYMVIYFVLSMHDMLTVDPESSRACDIPVVATLSMHGSPYLIMPYTLSACQQIRTHLCGTPLTDTVLAEVQRVSTLFIDRYLPELWLAFLPLAQTLENGESRLHTYFGRMTRVHQNDTFRSSFLNLLF